MAVDPLSQVSVEREILRISGLLDHQVTEIAKRARNAAQSEADYKLAYAKALIVAGGKTVADRESEALIECEDLYRARLAADAVLLAAQEAGRSYRAQIDALRTLAANQRAAIAYSEGVG